MRKELMAIGMAIMLVMTFMPTSVAQAPELPDPGITPDSTFYGLDVALDRISLLIASFRGPQVHALKGLEIAQERLAEARAMAERGKFEAMARAEQEHGKALGRVKADIRAIEHVNATKEIEAEVELERECAKHRERVEEFRSELKVKIEIEGNVTPEQQALIDSILSNLEDRLGEVEIEIRNEKAKTKVKIQHQTNKSEEEINIEVREIERRKGLVKMSERALEQIEDTMEEIAKMQAIVEEMNITEPAVLALIEQAQARLDQAQTAFEQDNYGEAFGQAVAAERLAENAEWQIEKMEEIEERLEKIREEIEERRAEIEERMEEVVRERLRERERVREQEQTGETPTGENETRMER
ncbi:MAG: DUF5667 domain-containing protein [Methanocellales archaeon]|nr:DUF5667 domain-containing protein [Methanocellales archaeon]